MSKRLASLIDAHGVGFTADAERVRSLLVSSLGDLEPEISLLVAGCDSGVTADLLRARGSASRELFATLAQRLVTDRGLSPRGARWVVDTWAWALGVEEPVAPVPPYPIAADPQVPVRRDDETYLLSPRPPFRVRDHSFSVALLAFVIATVATMVVLTRNDPAADGALAGSVASPAPHASAGGSVSVPALVSMTRFQAVERLRSVGLGHAVTTRSTARVDRGIVLRQDPAPGASVSDGSRVSLVVAAPPRRVGLPTGLSFVRTTTSITISWEAPRDGSGVERYEIWRDGRLIGERASGRRTFVDRAVSHGDSHLYGVKAIGYNGTQARSRSHRVTVPSPPPSPAPSPSPATGGVPPPAPPPPPPSPPPPCPAPDPDFC